MDFTKLGQKFIGMISDVRGGVSKAFAEHADSFVKNNPNSAIAKLQEGPSRDENGNLKPLSSFIRKNDRI